MTGPLFPPAAGGPARVELSQTAITVPTWTEARTTGDPAGIPSVWACTALIAGTVTQLALQVRRGAEVLPLPRWLADPDDISGELTRRELMSTATASLCLRGLAAWWAEPVGGESWALRPLDPATIDAVMDRRGRRTWYLDGDQVRTVRGRRAGLLVAGLQWLPDRALPVGPLQLARQTIDGITDTDTYAARIFRTGRTTSGQRLETDQDITQATAEKWRDQWTAAHNDPAADSIPVLGAGLRLATDLLSPRDAAWIEAREFGAQEVARLFLVPPRLIGAKTNDSVTYQTARDNDRHYLTHCVSRYSGALADALSRLLRSGRGPAEAQRAHFDAGPLLAPSPTDAVNQAAVGLGAGIYTLAEARDLVGLPAEADRTRTRTRGP